MCKYVGCVFDSPICLKHCIQCSLSLFVCVHMCFVCLCVFMSNSSIRVDLCLTSQLLKVPQLDGVQLFTHGATCFTH